MFVCALLCIIIITYRHFSATVLNVDLIYTILYIYASDYSFHFYSLPSLPCLSLRPHTTDRLDAVGTFRKRKRLQSEQEDDNEEEEEELSLLEYLRRRDKKIATGKKKKRVRLGSQ